MEFRGFAPKFSPVTITNWRSKSRTNRVERVFSWADVVRTHSAMASEVLADDRATGVDLRKHKVLESSSGLLFVWGHTISEVDLASKIKDHDSVEKVVERARDLRLVGAEGWDLVWRSSSSLRSLFEFGWYLEIGGHFGTHWGVC